MKAWRKYDIDIFKLSNKKHSYEYDLDSSFFSLFEDSLIKEGKLKAEVTFDKSETMIQTSFHINGSVELTCDRSLEEFDFPVKLIENLVFKFSSENEELSDEMINIKGDTQRINVAQYLYEFIGLSIPMKKLHPKFSEEEDSEEDKLIYTTKSEYEAEEDQEEKDLDPRWDILNNLKNRDN